MDRRPAALVFSAVVLLATAWLFWTTPKGLFPTDDTGQLLATTEAAEGVSYDELVNREAAVAEVVAKDPDVESVTSSVGTTAAANQGQLTIDLKPIDQRHRQRRTDHARPVDGDVERAGNHHVLHQNPPAISIGGLALEEPLPVHIAERRHRGARLRRCWPGSSASSGSSRF